MTRDEFQTGWILLTIQPWGRRYSGTDMTARVQQEFYYQRVHTLPHAGWESACELFASGDHWPSVEDVRGAVLRSLPARYQLPDHREGVEKPELLVRIESYRKLAIEKPNDGRHVTILEAAETLLPAFEREHPEGHEDISPCRWLIASLKAFRASQQVLKQEREAGR